MNDLISNILVGVDFSEGSTMALRYAARLAMQTGARLHVLNVHGNGASLAQDPFAVGFNVEDYLQHLRESVERRRAALADLVEREVTVPFANKILVSQSLREGE